jgi:hypothetical protein
LTGKAVRRSLFHLVKETDCQVSKKDSGFQQTACFLSLTAAQLSSMLSCVLFVLWPLLAQRLFCFHNFDPLIVCHIFLHGQPAFTQSSISDLRYKTLRHKPTGKGAKTPEALNRYSSALPTLINWQVCSTVSKTGSILTGVSSVIVAPFACKFWITAIDYLFQLFS